MTIKPKVYFWKEVEVQTQTRAQCWTSRITTIYLNHKQTWTLARYMIRRFFKINHSQIFILPRPETIKKLIIREVMKVDRELGLLPKQTKKSFNHSSISTLQQINYRQACRAIRVLVATTRIYWKIAANTTINPTKIQIIRNSGLKTKKKFITTQLTSKPTEK